MIADSFGTTVARACARALGLGALGLGAFMLAACDTQGRHDQYMQGIANGDLPSGVACLEPAEGCACPGNQAPVACSPAADEMPDGKRPPGVCLQGTRYCRAGRFSACEDVRSFPAPVAKSANALVDPSAKHAQCDDCDPTCFRVVDNFDPDDGPLAPSIASGLVYHSSGAGVTLKPSTSLPPPPDGGVPDGGLYLSMPEGLSASDMHTSSMNPAQAEVYLLLDQSLTMAEETQWLQQDFATGTLLAPPTSCSGGNQTLLDQGLAGALQCLFAPAPAVAPLFGIGVFRDLPFSPYATDQSLPAAQQDPDARHELAYANVRTMSSSLAFGSNTGSNQLGNLESSGDPDVAGSQIPALHAIATGSGMDMGLFRSTVPTASCPSGSFGYPCFTNGHKPIVVMVTDAPFHNGPDSATYGYDYDPMNLGISGSASDLITLPTGSSDDWSNAYMIPGAAESTIAVFQGYNVTAMPSVPADVVGCGANPLSGDSIFKFDVSSAGRVNLSTEGSDIPMTLAVFDKPPPARETLPSSDHSNEYFGVAYPLGSVSGRDVIVQGNTSDPAAAPPDMISDYQHPLVGTTCSASSGSPDAAFKFTLGSSDADLALSLDMGAAHAVLAVYDANALAPRWPAQQAPINVPNGAADQVANVLQLPDVASVPYLSVVGDSSGLSGDYDMDALTFSACSADPASHDAIVSFQLHEPHRLRFDTDGSSFDTVISLHSAPPLPESGSTQALTASSSNEDAASAFVTGTVDGLHLTISGNTSGMHGDVDDHFGCGMNNTCADAVHRIHVDNRTTLRMHVSGTGFDPALVVTRADPSWASGHPLPFALGQNHSCALSGGAVYCWGADDHGQLGDGGGASDPDSNSAVKVAGVSDVVQVAAAGDHACAINAQHNVYCWGAGAAGQIGDDGGADRYSAVEVLDASASGASPLANAAAIACGAAHCCALLGSGDAVCWGDNGHGQVGDGSKGNQRTRPVVVAGGERFELIAAGGDQSCAIRSSDHTVFCWGDGSHGKLGNGSGGDQEQPTMVNGLGGFASSVLVGQDHACAILSDGHVRCWGDGEFGQLGQGAGDLGDYSTPVTVLAADGSALIDVKHGAGAGRAHTCVTTLLGLVECWGDNPTSALGNGSSSASPLAGSAFDLLDATDVASAADQSCALRADGSLYCWGDGAHGKLGNASSATAPAPVGAQQPSSGAAGVSFGTGLLDTAFSAKCGGHAQPPEPGCQALASSGQNYFVCSGHPRSFGGAVQSCKDVRYNLVDVNMPGENAALTPLLTAGTWIGEKRATDDAAWLNLSPGYDITNLSVNEVFHTTTLGHNDCSSGPCTWVPTDGQFTFSADPDLVSSSPWSPASTFPDDEPSVQLGHNCVVLGTDGKWSTDVCATAVSPAPWLPPAGQTRLATDTLGGSIGSPNFGGRTEHDYACEAQANADTIDVTLDPGDYFVTVKGTSMTSCEGPYQLQIDDLGTPSGGFLECNDDEDSENDTNYSAIERNLDPGTYYLLIKGYRINDRGSFTLNVRDLDKVQSTALACVNGAGVGAPAVINMHALAGKTYYALVKGETALDKGDYRLNVRDVSAQYGHELACDAGGGGNGISTLALDLQAGSYYAIATGNFDSSDANFHLAIGGGMPVPGTFVPASYDDTIAALNAAHIRVGTVLSCDSATSNCSDAFAQAGLLAADTNGLARTAASADGVPTEVATEIQLLEAVDTLTATLVYMPDTNPGFVGAAVTAIDEPSNLCTIGSNGNDFSACAAGSRPSFKVAMTNPALNPVPPAPAPAPFGAYHFTLHLTGVREGDAVFTEDVPVWVAPTGSAPPGTYMIGSYHQDFEAKSCDMSLAMGATNRNLRPSWDDLIFNADVRPDTRIQFYACTADSLTDLGSCDSGAPSSGYERVVTITAGQAGGTPCTVMTQATDCPYGYCSPYTQVCNYLEGASCMTDMDCPGEDVGRCRIGPSNPTLGTTCAVIDNVANPASALVMDNYRFAMRMRFDLESLGDGSRAPAMFSWQTEYRCRAVE